MNPPVLAVDIGTSSVRAGLFDEGAAAWVDPPSSHALTLHTDSSGRAEVDPSELLDAVEATVEETRGNATVRAVGGSCFWHSLMGITDDGRPLTPVFTWADTRSEEDARKLRQHTDEPRYHARTGCMLRAGYWPAKLRWFRRTQPQIFDQVRYWVGPAEWVWWRMSGDLAPSASMASGTGLVDYHAAHWDPETLELAGIEADQLIAPGAAVSEAGWIPAVGDGAASNLGSGATAPQRAALNLGTSAAVRVVSTTEPPLGLFRYEIDRARPLVGGAVSNAGNLRAWCLRELRLSEADAETALATRPFPDHGLVVVPHWMGERAPRWRESVTGSITGITQATTALDILQATTEAAFYGIARIVNVVLEADTQIVVSGGLANSSPLLQRLANVLGRPLWPLEDREASLLGAAQFALEHVGGRGPAPRLAPAVEPDPAAVARYADDRARFEEADRER